MIAQTYTSAVRLIQGLRHFGAECPDWLVKALEGFCYQNLETDAVLNVWRREGAPLSESHWVVWDVRKRKFLDPLPVPYQRLRVSAYLPVKRPAR